MNFPENFDDSPCDCPACNGPADLQFGAAIMEAIHTAGPMPIGAVGMLAMASGADPYAVAGVMSLIQTAGLIKILDDNGNAVWNPVNATMVALTDLGAAEVERCNALAAEDKEREQDGPRFDPNNN